MLLRSATLLSPTTRRATILTPGATPRWLGSLEPISPATAVPCCDEVAIGSGELVAKL